MNRRVLIYFLSIIFFSGILLPVSFAASDQKPPRRPNTVLYKVKTDASKSQLGALNAVLRARGAAAARNLQRLGIILDVYADGSYSEEQVCAQLMASGAVDFAEPDYLVAPALEANDPYISSQWQHTKIQSFGAWDTTTGSASVLVAVCDTGISSAHPDLSYNLELPGYNTVDGSTNTEPVFNHGTGVAGCIGAVGSNSTGVAGVAWDVSILPIRITNSSDGMAYISDAAEGISYAADRGAKVVNLSFRMASYAAIDSAAQYLRDRGGLLFVSAGNDGTDPGWPDYASFIAVGATTSTDVRASWSNYGTFVDIVSPGSGVYSTSGATGYASLSGTSFSSPIAAGLAALLYSINPNFTPEEVEGFIFGGCVDLGDFGEDNVFGRGRIDAAAAVALAIEGSFNLPPVSAPTAAPTVGVAPLPANFDGSHSYDTDGEIVAYAWDFGDGTNGSGINASHTYASAGTYTAKLTVSDNAGASASETVQIQVEPDPTKVISVGNIEMTLASVSGGTVAEARVTIVDYDGAPRSGAVVTGAWSGTQSSTTVGSTGADGTVVLSSPTNSGAFSYTFTVTNVSADGYTYDPGLNNETTDSISSEETQNSLPVAAPLADPTSGTGPLTIYFDGSASYDPDGQIVSYEWNFGDGATASGITATHVYQSGGTFTATLTVCDDQGGKDSKSLTISVTADEKRVISVSDIDLVAWTNPGGTVGQVTVTVVDANGSARGEVTVTGEFSGVVSGTVKGTTKSDETVVLSSKRTKKSGTISFSVTGLALSGYVYDATLNNETYASVLTNP